MKISFLKEIKKCISVADFFCIQLYSSGGIVFCVKKILECDEQKIILDYINPEVRDKLRKSQAVIIVETVLENIKDAYIADMNIVDKIPVDWSQIGLTTWENVSLKA